jgi:hypothetical protein
VRVGKRAKDIGWKEFFPSIGNLCFAPLLALMAVFQHFAFFANTAVLANGRFA